MSSPLLEIAKKLKENPQEYIDHLMQFPDNVLEKKLDIVREQKQMAYDQKKNDSFELLSIKEDLIIKVRLIKSENETEKPERKPRQKNYQKNEQKNFKTVPSRQTILFQLSRP